MPHVVYTVTAALSDEPDAAAYTRWLMDEHAPRVVLAGADSFEILRLQPLDAPAAGAESSSPLVECRYRFKSRAALDDYLLHQAPRLREQGKAFLRTLRRGEVVRFERKLGTLVG